MIDSPSIGISSHNYHFIVNVTSQRRLVKSIHQSKETTQVVILFVARQISCLGCAHELFVFGKLEFKKNFSTSKHNYFANFGPAISLARYMLKELFISVKEKHEVDF